MSGAQIVPIGGRALQVPTSALGKLIDELLQSFEDHRHGLPDAVVQQGEAATASFFGEVYDREHKRVADAIAMYQPHLVDEARAAFVREVDSVVKTVVIPAYARLTTRFTARER